MLRNHAKWACLNCKWLFNDVSTTVCVCVCVCVNSMVFVPRSCVLVYQDLGYGLPHRVSLISNKADDKSWL